MNILHNLHEGSAQLSINFSVQFKGLVLINLFLYVLALKYLQDCLSSLNNKLLIILLFSELVCGVQIGRQCFSTTTPTWRDRLPLPIRLEAIVIAFWKVLQTEIFQKAFAIWMLYCCYCSVNCHLKDVI